MQVHTGIKFSPAQTCRTEEKNFNQNIMASSSQRMLSSFTLFDYSVVAIAEFDEGWWDSLLSCQCSIWWLCSPFLPETGQKGRTIICANFR